MKSAPLRKGGFVLPLPTMKGLPMPQVFRELYQELLGYRPPYQTIVWGLPVAGLIVVCVALLVLCMTLVPAKVARPQPVIMKVTNTADEQPAMEVSPRSVPVVFTRVAVSAPVIEYPVKAGETLIGLATRFGTDYRVIARDSRITNPHRISIGQVLRIKIGHSGHLQAPAVSVKRHVSLRELAGNGGAPSGKHLSHPEAPATVRLSPVPAPVALPPVSPVSQTSAQSLSEEVFRTQIYRVVALRKVKFAELSKAEQAELNTLTADIRQTVLARYKLPNPDCLYVEAAKFGKTEREQILFRARCIRENYGAVIAETARRYSLVPAFIEAVIYVESGGRPDAISSTGCTGAKQFTMASAKGFGLRDRFNPFESIRAGGRHLADNLRRWNGNVARATAHFNIGGIAGTAGFQASQFPYVREVMRVQALIESELPR